MSSVIIPPATSFDFSEQFNLAVKKIFIDLSPSVGLDKVAIDHVTGVIEHKYKNALPEQTIFTAPDLYGVFSVAMPTVQGVPVWGVYTTTVTAFMVSGEVYKVKKIFNLCPPSDADPFNAKMQGQIKVSVDCCEALLFVSDFVCLLYKGKLPSKQEYNLVHIFPPESKVANAKVDGIPYSAPAYNGLNKISGFNLSRFDFGDNISVVIRVEGVAEKNVRCVPDYEAITAGMKRLLQELRECNGRPEDYAKSFEEAETLLWSVSVGHQIGEDISEDLVRLEEILGITCQCIGCPGEKVGECQACQSVTNPSAINDNGSLVVNWNSVGVPNGSFVRIETRPFCGNNPLSWQVQFPDTPTTGGDQSASFAVTPATFYEVRVTTVVDGSPCASQVIDTGNAAECPLITGINAA